MHYDLFRKELMRIVAAQEFGPFMKMSGTFSFIMGEHQWRIEKKLAGGGAMMDLGIYIVQAAMQQPMPRPFQSLLTRAETTTGFLQRDRGNNQVHLKLSKRRHTRWHYEFQRQRQLL
jgi:predicted dehydrogenase